MVLKDWKRKKGTKNTYEKRDGSWLIIDSHLHNVYISQFKKAKTKSFKTTAQAVKFARLYMSKN